jgi:hypothetical protein
MSALGQKATSAAAGLGLLCHQEWTSAKADAMSA